MKYLPNTLSFLRVFLSICLLLFPADSPLFFLFYLLCGLSDVLDGYIARRLSLSTPLGAKLDSLGDLCFYGVIFYLLWTHTSFFRSWYVIVLLVTVLLIKLMAFLFTKWKFGHFGSLHTTANKVAGLIVFFSAPAFLYFSKTPIFLLLPLGLVSLFASVEELLILNRIENYTPDIKSIFTIK